MADRFDFSKMIPYRYRIVAIPLIAIFAIIFIVITMMKINSQLSKNSFYAINGTQENYSWAIAKLSMQLSQFETLIIKKKYDHTISDQKIKSKLDIIFSRVNVLMTKSESTQFLYMQKDYSETITKIHNTLLLIDENISSKSQNFSIIAEQASSLQPQISYLANLADHSEVLQRTQSLNDFLDKRNTLRILLTITSILCIALIFMAALHHNSLRNALLSRKRAFDNKNAFLGKMGHELRTSLQAVIGSIDVISHSKNNINKDVINRLENTAIQIERQMNDLAEYAKIDNGMIPLQITTFNLKQTIDTIIQNPSLTSINDKVEVIHHCENEIYIKSDKTRIIQIVENLFSNALKYTNKGIITITSTCDKNLTISIKDTGYGIPKGKLSDIFNPFFRVDESEVRIPSFGMGLAIVDGLVKALKGEIEVKSEEGIGSEFIVKLPVIVEQSVVLQNTSFKQIDYPVPANLNIIVIDDNELSCFTIAEMLSTYDHICETSTSPTRALQKLARKPYDIILCDLQMPVITGDQLLKHIRDNEGPNMITPFVFISAYAEKFNVMNTIVLSKPVRSEELLSVISKALIK